MRRYKDLLLNSKDIERSSYIWNAAAGLLFAMQSAFMLIIITRTNGLDDAGVFSIAYAIAGLMSYIGEFGVRKYQVSDVHEQNCFSDYFTFRLFSCSAMILSCFGYAMYGVLLLDYSWNKFLVIMMIGVVKLVEGFVDVFHGRFQQKDRLDVAAKADSARICFGVIACTAALIITRDLLISCTVWAVSVIFGMCVTTLLVSPQFGRARAVFHLPALKRIFLECLPLFIGAFLLLYVGNAPKYAIDTCMTETDQACYNFIFMPVFVVGMLANFIFNPVLVRMSIEWDRGHFTTVRNMILKQIGVIAGLTALAVAVALTIGCPVLGLMYNADLSGLKAELCILMIGGGMLALVNFFTVVVTVIRKQKHLIVGYLLTAVCAWFTADIAVGRSGLTGASVLYTALMTLLSAVFAVILIICFRRAAAARKKNTGRGDAPQPAL